MVGAGMLLVRCPVCGITIECGGNLIASAQVLSGQVIRHRCASCGEWFEYVGADTFNDPTYRTRSWVHWMDTYGSSEPIGRR